MGNWVNAAVVTNNTNIPMFNGAAESVTEHLGQEVDQQGALRLAEQLT